MLPTNVNCSGMNSGTIVLVSILWMLLLCPADLQYELEDVCINNFSTFFLEGRFLFSFLSIDTVFIIIF